MGKGNTNAAVRMGSRIRSRIRCRALEKRGGGVCSFPLSVCSKGRESEDLESNTPQGLACLKESLPPSYPVYQPRKPIPGERVEGK